MNALRLAALAMLCFALHPAATSAETIAQAAPAFDRAAYARYLRKGDEAAAGRLVVQLQNGALVAKNGASVLALPDSELARWWLAESAVAIRERADDRIFREPALPQQLRPFVRYAVTDGDGNFRIGNLPRGRYIFRGRLSLAFPRTISDAPQSAAPYDVYGDQTSVRRSIVVFDYSIVWLDSFVVRVGTRPPDDIAFHLVARRDTVDARRS